MITLLTDFGYEDPYVAEMKAVILSIDPKATIVDITHAVRKHDIFHGALILKAAYKWFPKGTIHVSVVDPGVGSERKPLVVETKNYFFVGPDNGLLSLAALEEGVKNVYEIKVRSKSFTFHGRDVFAPAAAFLSIGKNFEEFCSKVDDFLKLEMPGFEISEDISGFVIYIDSFGNAVTNIPWKAVESILEFGKKYKARIGKRKVEVRLVRAYSEVGVGEKLMIPNSFDFLEFAINQGNFAKRMKLRVGERVEIEL